MWQDLSSSSAGGCSQLSSAEKKNKGETSADLHQNVVRWHVCIVDAFLRRNVSGVICRVLVSKW